MKLTKAQKEIYYRITSDLKDYDKETSLDNIIDELKHQIETELWHKEEYDDSYSDLNVRVAKNLLKLLIAEKRVNKITNGRGGKREGAGRPKGSTKEPTVIIQRRVKKEWIPAIDELIKRFRKGE